MFAVRIRWLASMQTGAIVTFGDLIGDGTQSTADANNRWPDHRKRHKGEMKMKKALKSISIKSNQLRRIIMEKTIISVVVFASMLVVGAVPNAQAGQCSNASLKGAYGFLEGHTVVPAGTPFTVLGRFNFDAKGNFTATVTINNNGTVTHLNDFGHYTVNADCTGKIGILGDTGTIEIVLVDGGKEFYSLATNPSSIVTTFSVFKKQFPDD
jgi:hypothetical protein